ncbi:MAG: hydrolase TatD [Gammaproteobacteria bacterium]|nr:hydrolase TatD [Gammaproteobacteria bacterium]
MIDIGANLTDKSFDKDRFKVIERASLAGVKKIIITGSCDESNIRASMLSEGNSGILYSTAGVHPHHASDYSSASDKIIRNLITKKHVVAVGECGLDYYRNLSSREDQIKTFTQQIDIAKDYDSPIFLHQREAHYDFINILRPSLPKLKKAVVHCFTGSAKELHDYINMGLYIGITGWICDERRGNHLKKIISVIPDNKLFIETDSPYLLPRTMDSKPKNRRNEPMYLLEVAKAVAEARGQSIRKIIEVTTENAIRFFQL